MRRDEQMAQQVRDGCLCRSCGNAGKTFFPDATHDGETAACATCGGPVSLPRYDGLPDACESKLQPDPDVDVRARAIQQRRHAELLWFDDIMFASFWWDSACVEGQQAAALLWYINPIDNPNGTPADSEDCRAFRAMQHEFTAVEKTEPVPRKLAQWLEIAKQKSLRYNSWIHAWLLSRTANKEATSAVPWTVSARQIADDLHRKDAKGGVWSSLKDMGDRVAIIAAEKDIKGAQGPLTGANILREALQGGRWKRPRKAKTGKPGTLEE